MAWAVGAVQVNLESGTTDGATTLMIDYVELDSDPVPAVSKDKSDWFLKRMIIDGFPTFGGATNTPTSTARLWSWAVATMSYDAAQHVQDDELPVMDPSTWDIYRRLLQSGVNPVYATWTPALTSDDLHTVSGVATPGDFAVVDHPWGLARVHADFSISNAGLVDESGVYIHCSLEAGPGSYDWVAGETLSTRWIYRALLQKRRG